jgi:hypothetical protein
MGVLRSGSVNENRLRKSEFSKEQIVDNLEEHAAGAITRVRRRRLGMSQ